MRLAAVWCAWLSPDLLPVAESASNEDLSVRGLVPGFAFLAEAGRLFDADYLRLTQPKGSMGFP